MTRLLTRTTLFAAVMLTGAAQAQTPSVRPVPEVPTTQGATPPNGVARGVIRPTRPVDPEMVAKPPAPQRPTMPVITPPGTAR